MTKLSDKQTPVPTAEEILKSKNLIIYRKQRSSAMDWYAIKEGVNKVVEAMEEYATTKTQELRKELEEKNKKIMELNRRNEFNKNDFTIQNDKLRKKIEELKEEMRIKTLNNLRFVKTNGDLTADNQRLQERVEKLNKGIIENPVNDIQIGFNIGIQACVAKLRHALGLCKVYSLEEFKKLLTQ